ncbi:unnamed protein product, partial [Mycena citricolor]
LLGQPIRYASPFGSILVECKDFYEQSRGLCSVPFNSFWLHSLGKRFKVLSPGNNR